MQTLKSFLIWPLLLSGLFLFSLSTYSDSGAEDTSGKDVDELEKSMQDFKQSNQLLQAMENMDPAARKRLEEAVATNNTMAIMKEMKGLKLDNGKSVDMKSMMNMSLSTFQSQSEAELLAQFKQSTKATIAGPIVEKFPKLLIFLVKLLRDKIALPSLFQLLDDRKKLMIFAGCNIFTIILGFMIKRAQKKSSTGVFDGIAQWSVRFTFLTGLRIGIFIFFYGTIAKPSWIVFKNVFFA
ncbi:hypothetical protein OAT67_07395 [Bacteriovoracaceae bacterium]|nr:hypothetical protein [Bacteriovoracaceae bacterium]